MGKIWDLVGGIHPPENKQQSVQQPIASLPLPDKLVIPLSQHIGAPASILVAEGDQVLKGQLLAEPNGFVSVGVHAPTSGTIASIGDHPVPHASGMSLPCITLIPDGKEQWVELSGVADYKSLGGAELVEKIRQAGIAGLGGAGFPSAVKLATDANIDTLIINGTECEPYITADDMLMREHPAEIINGIQILAHILGNPAQILLGIEDNKPEAIAAFQPLLEGTGIELVSFPTRYPSGGEKQLIQILTGKEVPSGGLPAHIGIVCQNVGTTHAIHHAICHGRPLISRITTVTGNACGTNGNYEVLLGTPIRHLLAHNSFNQADCVRLVMGGPMMGFTLHSADIPVVKTTNCILAPTAQELPPPPPAQPCIRCGMCAEACPASLLPQQLLWYAQSENYERLEAHNLADCIECGACSYVCPSNIPLVQYYRASKGEMRKLEQEKAKSDRARERFEFHQARLEKAEAEKQAKREARKKAAEQAAALQAEKQTQQSANNTDTGADDVIQQALARAAQRQASPEQQKDTLQRGVARAESHLASVQQRLDALQQEGTEQQQSQAKAAVADAQLRLEEAQRKLAAIDTTSGTSNITTAKDDTAVQQAVMEKLAASPQALLEKKIASIKSRIAVTEQKIADAGDTDPTVKTALESGLQKQQAKLQEAEQQLAQAQSDTPEQLDNVAQDAASIAIAKAQAKAAQQANMSEEDKLHASLASLGKRIEKATAKLTTAKQEGSEHIDALQNGLDKLLQKQQDIKGQLAAIAPAAATNNAGNTDQKPADAASLAIEKAKLKAAAMANMSEEEKLRDAIRSLQERVEKAQKKLADAEEAGADHVDALRNGAEKLAAKLADTEQQLAQLLGVNAEDGQ